VFDARLRLDNTILAVGCHSLACVSSESARDVKSRRYLEDDAAARP
jgi:hypothetical protein